MSFRNLESMTLPLNREVTIYERDYDFIYLPIKAERESVDIRRMPTPGPMRRKQKGLSRLWRHK